MTSDPHDELDFRAELARLDRDMAETAKLIAETHKLFAESRDLSWSWHESSILLIIFIVGVILGAATTLLPRFLP
jgi:hypothetical protein